ncbi:response regulator [Marinomonas ostreistagni]|uniref:Response regulator n=1 Tax=Marinomonas ostreistagni TaxID=359209 RepID=A0ABS0ZE67_9GAMM|nr:response regulator [Marinomonas ostreistagni]MBJ7551967.1 response regulator [Marinomonas ostreistagni]
MNKPNFSDKKALLIEDMAEARIMQKKMLNDFGFKSIEIAMKAESAIELLRTQSYDVILSDYNLGNGKDGQQLLEEVRHSHLIPNTSTYLMVTAETSTEMVMGAIEYSPDGYITKPFSQAMLERRLLKLMMNKEQLLEINKALDASDYEKAVTEARKVSKENPTLASRCNRIIGDSLISLEKYQEALEVFKACRKESRMPWAVFGEAKCHYFLNNVDKAEQKFRQLTLDNKFFVSAYDWLAKTLVKKGELDEAQAILVDAVGRSPKNLKRQIELGKLSLEVHDNLMAEMSFRRAVFLAKHSCFNEADVYLQHMTSIVALAREGDIPSRQISNFQTTLEKVHQSFFNSAKVRSESYLLEMELYAALGDTKTMHQIEEVWNNDIESGQAEPITPAAQSRINQIKS